MSGQRTARIARPLCRACGGRVYNAAKSHRHYTHLSKTDCTVRRVEEIDMEVVEWA